MKHLIALMAVAFVASAQAHPVNVPVNNQYFGLEPIVLKNHPLGNGGVELQDGVQTGTAVLGDNIFHTPQYMPGFPTAATIWPRVIEVKCTDRPIYRRAHGMQDQPAVKMLKNCDGYNWSPAMGRAEYLFVTPVMEKQPEPPETIIVYKPGPERVILKEVPPKKKRE